MNLQPSDLLHTTITGSETGPSILFLHGGGSAGWMWQPAAAYLQDYHCIIPDLPEHGQSRSIGPFSMALAAEKTAQIIRRYAHNGRAHIVGLSEGAQVAVQLLATEPALAERTVISSALLRPMPGANWMARPGWTAWGYRITVAPLKKCDFWIRLNMKHAAGIPEQYYTRFKKDFQEMTESGFTNLMTANQRFRLPGGLENVKTPALVVVGKREYRVMHRSARDLAAVMPNAKAVQVSLGEKASLAEEHNWAVVAPKLFAQTVRAWIEGLELPREITELDD